MGAPSTRLTTVFSKRPLAGQVKTRLSPPLSPDEAARLAEAMLDDCVDRHLACTEYATALAVAPEAELGWFQGRYPAAGDVTAQRGDGLGERLAAWFGERCQAGRTVVVVGSDAPLLDSATVVGAHERLEAGADLVFAPDGSGGYSMVGARRPVRQVFTEVTMSTGDMFEATLDVARGLGLAVELVRECYDVDREEDVWRLARDLNTLLERGGGPEFPTRTHGVLQELLGTPSV